MLDFNIQHVLILAILICILYLLLNNTICNTICNIEGFSVGGRKIKKLKELKKELHELRKKKRKHKKNKLKGQINELEEQINELEEQIKVLEYELQNKKETRDCLDPKRVDCGDGIQFCSGDQCCEDGSTCPIAKEYHMEGCLHEKNYECAVLPCITGKDIDCNDNGNASGNRPKCKCICNSGWKGENCKEKIIGPCDNNIMENASLLTKEKIESGVMNEHDVYIINKNTPSSINTSFTNRGTLFIDRSINIQKPFKNEGTLCIVRPHKDYRGYLRIENNFKNKGKIVMKEGDIYNTKEGTITNTNGATITNYGTNIFNHGLIKNNKGATINNLEYMNVDGTIINYGLINNDGGKANLHICGNYKGNGEIKNHSSMCSNTNLKELNRHVKGDPSKKCEPGQCK